MCGILLPSTACVRLFAQRSSVIGDCASDTSSLIGSALTSALMRVQEQEVRRRAGSSLREQFGQRPQAAAATVSHRQENISAEELRRRREQEASDAELARRLQVRVPRCKTGGTARSEGLRA